MTVIIKGHSAFEMSLVSRIKDVQSPHIKFYNIYFKCKSIEDAGGAIFVKRKKGRWLEYIPEHGKCPFCGNQVDLLGGKANNFCGECGADMRGEQ